MKTCQTCSNEIYSIFTICNSCKYPENKNYEKKLNNFELEYLKDTMEDSIDFKHPFTCKLLGSRGSGKTTYIVNYLKQFHLDLNFDRIIWISTSQHQILLKGLDNLIISYCDPDTDMIIKISDYLHKEAQNINTVKKNLIIFDDCMSNIRNNKIIQDLYTRGRHLHASIFSLEQHLNYSSNIERGNTDYFLIFKINDILGLNTFRKKFCSDLRETVFNDVCNFCWNKNLPLLITIQSINYKYRLNFNDQILINSYPLDTKKILDLGIKIELSNPKIKKIKWYYYPMIVLSYILD